MGFPRSRAPNRMTRWRFWNFQAFQLSTWCTPTSSASIALSATSPPLPGNKRTQQFDMESSTIKSGGVGGAGHAKPWGDKEGSEQDKESLKRIIVAKLQTAGTAGDFWSKIRLLAPKVLLDYLRPMILIPSHPIQAKCSIEDDLSWLLIIWLIKRSRPPMT